MSYRSSRDRVIYYESKRNNKFNKLSTLILTTSQTLKVSPWNFLVLANRKSTFVTGLRPGTRPSIVLILYIENTKKYITKEKVWYLLHNIPLSIWYEILCKCNKIRKDFILTSFDIFSITLEIRIFSKRTTGFIIQFILFMFNILYFIMSSASSGMK